MRLLLATAIFVAGYYLHEACYLQIGGTDFRLVHPNDCEHKSHKHEN